MRWKEVSTWRWAQRRVRPFEQQEGLRRKLWRRSWPRGLADMRVHPDWRFAEPQCWRHVLQRSSSRGLPANKQTKMREIIKTVWYSETTIHWGSRCLNLDKCYKSLDNKELDFQPVVGVSVSKLVWIKFIAIVDR